MDNRGEQPNVWGRKYRDAPGSDPQESKQTPKQIKFTEEFLRLKEVMDAKLKCQNSYEHKVESGKWVFNTSHRRDSNFRGERYVPDEWEECRTCNI